jgi:hypothetical protein
MENLNKIPIIELLEMFSKIWTEIFIRLWWLWILFFCIIPIVFYLIYRLGREENSNNITKRGYVKFKYDDSGKWRPNPCYYCNPKNKELIKNDILEITNDSGKWIYIWNGKKWIFKECIKYK